MRYEPKRAYRSGLQSWFKFALNDSLRDLWILIDDKYDANVKVREMLYEKMDKLTKTLESTLSKAFDEALENVIKDLSGSLSEAVGKMKEVGEGAEEIAGTIASQKALIESAANTYKEKIGELKTNSMLLITDSVKVLKENLDPLSEDMGKLQEQLNEIKVSLKAIEGMAKGG